MPTIVARVDGGTLFNGFMMIGVVVVHLEVEFGWIVVHMMGEACWIVAVNLMGTISVFYLVGWVDQDTVVLYEG